MLRPVAMLVLAACALPFAAAMPAQAQVAPDPVEPPEVAAITDLHSGPDPVPIVAVWRDERRTDRFHLVTAADIELDEWVLRATAVRWLPRTVRLTMLSRQGVLSATVEHLEGADATPSGTAATSVEPMGASIDIPGRPGETSALHLIARRTEDTTADQVALTPIDADDLQHLPPGGLRSPTLGLTLDPEGLPRPALGPLTSGPAATRTTVGLRLTVLEPPPTAVGEVPVATVEDQVIVRADPGLRAPVLLRLTVGASAVTAESADGEPVLVEGVPWQRTLSVDPTTSIPSVEVSLEEIATLGGSPLTEHPRIGLVRTVTLDDGSIMLADGLDVVFDSLPAGRAAATAAAELGDGDTSESNQSKVYLLVGAGLLVVLVVIGPIVRFSIQERRARRERDGR